MANVTAGVIRRPSFQEDRLNAHFEKLIIKLCCLHVGLAGGLRRSKRNKHAQQDGSRYNETSRNYLWQNPRNHNHLTFASSNSVLQPAVPRLQQRTESQL
jgi:hypothetical protein